MVISLDGHALDASRRLAVASTARGSVWWRSDADALHGWMVEWRGGKLTPVTEAPPRREDAGWRLDVEPNELFVLDSAAQAPSKLGGGR